MPSSHHWKMQPAVFHENFQWGISAPPSAKGPVPPVPAPGPLDRWTVCCGPAVKNVGRKRSWEPLVTLVPVRHLRGSVKGLETVGVTCPNPAEP